MSHIDSGGDPNSVEAGRELADVSIPALWHHGLYLLITCVAVWFAMMGLFKFTMARLSEGDPQVSAIARPAGQQPPEPRLLTNEPMNLEQFRTRETETLDNYYLDPAGGTIRLPIEIAKERLLQIGLPVRASVASSGSSSSSQLPAETPAPAATAKPGSGGH